MDTKKILEKIKKCLALSKSANEHEAAQALKHAQKLMVLYGIDDVDLQLSRITSVDIPCNKTFPKWQLNLLTLIDLVFGCKCYQKIDALGRSEIHFYGFNGKAEIASYAYEVLLRQIKRDRLEFIRTHLKRVRVAKNKTFRADKYCEGWIDGAYNSVKRMILSTEEEQMLDKYLNARIKNPQTIKPRNQSNSVTTSTTYDDKYRGYNAGKQANIHNAVNSNQKPTYKLG